MCKIEFISASFTDFGYTKQILTKYENACRAFDIKYVVAINHFIFKFMSWKNAFECFRLFNTCKSYKLCKLAKLKICFEIKH